MSPIGPFHGGILNRLSRLFNQSSSNRWLVSTQNPLRLDDYSEPEPDVILLKPSADDYTHRHPQAQDVFLLIEVADSTLEYDREEKLPVYGRAGVPEVWIVNLRSVDRESDRRGHRNLSRTTFHRLRQQSCFARVTKRCGMPLPMLLLTSRSY